MILVGLVFFKSGAVLNRHQLEWSIREGSLGMMAIPMRIESWSPIDLTENHVMSLLITEVFFPESSICKTFLNTLDLPIEQKMELWWWNIGDVQVWFQVPQTERGLPYVFPPSYTYDLCHVGSWIQINTKDIILYLYYILYSNKCLDSILMHQIFWGFAQVTDANPYATHPQSLGPQGERWTDDMPKDWMGS